MKIAIIGSGISGLTASYLLNKQHEITLFEKNDYIGGHTHTHDISIGEQTLVWIRDLLFTMKKHILIL